MAEIVFTDRYQAMGIPYPDPATCCKGQCEGTGLVPVSDPHEQPREGQIVYTEPDRRFADLWQAAHDEHCAGGWWSKVRILWKHREWWYWRSKLREWCDGWHFVKCPDCDGTGKATAPEGRGEEGRRVGIPPLPPPYLVL